MLMRVDTFPGVPLNAGIVARLNTPLRHAAVEVPAMGASATTAFDTVPAGSNVTSTRT